MIEFKGTPGPWNINNQWFGPTNAVSWVSIENDNKNIIAEAKGKHCSIPNKECKYNARLIAVAPELLEVLQEMVYLFAGEMPKGTPRHSACKKATSIINKALGL